MLIHLARIGKRGVQRELDRRRHVAAHIAVDRATAPLSVVDNVTAVWNFLIAIALAVTLIRVLQQRLWTWTLAPAQAAPDAPVAAAEGSRLSFPSVGRPVTEASLSPAARFDDRAGRQV